MDSEFLWVDECFVLDEAGNMIITSYVDLRPLESRTTIQGLVKGCRREHALEDTETILVSPLERFREEGQNLIRDEQEGLAMERTETVKPETPEEAVERRRIEDTNEAIELLGSEIVLRSQQKKRTVESSSKHISYGKEWWIFSTTLLPETEEQRVMWRASLDPAYDHESVIGQPAKFAEALGRMVAEQLGPQTNQIKNSYFQGYLGKRKGMRTKHPAQLIFHGPVVYTDCLFDKLMEDVDEMQMPLVPIFTKSATHAMQREYRFAIYRDVRGDETKFLTVSGMMRDALQRTKTGLVRLSPEADDETLNEEAEATQTVKSRKVLDKRVAATAWVKEREKTQSESRGSEGRSLNSESEMRECVHENTLTWDLDESAKIGDVLATMGQQVKDHTNWQREQESSPDIKVELGTSDEETVEEIAFKRNGTNNASAQKYDVNSVIHGKGRAIKSFQEKFADQISDPTFPLGGSSEPWAEEKLDREEVLRIYRFVATLAYKVTRVGEKNREAASSACWHAIQCIRNIYARLGDIVESVAIERERFVVIHIKASQEFKAEGQIVLSPSGVYAYLFKRQTGAKELGSCYAMLGQMFFPFGEDMEKFESFGWPPKDF